ncbi:MAG: hypothetical protein QXU98_04090 [Candidatus Parvarchaeota archaeon]
MAEQEQLVELVFWYPPAPMTPDSVISLGTDQYGMVTVDVQENWLQSQTINITPQAYTSWYTNNESQINGSKNYDLLSSFYQKMISPVGNYPNYAAYATATIEGYGFIWMPYSQWYQGTLTGTESGIVSITKYFPGLNFFTDIFNGLYKLYPNEVYALVEPSSPTPLNIVGNLASNIPWYVYAILGIAGVLLLISWMQRGGIFSAAQTIESTRKIRSERKGAEKERKEKEKEMEDERKRREKEEEEKEMKKREKEMEKEAKPKMEKVE